MQIPKVSITTFAEDKYLLNLKLWQKQKEVLETFWSENYTKAVWCLGRRSGKTLMAAISACYASCILADEYKKHLRQNERFYIITIANSADQAKLALYNIKDLIKNSVLLKELIVNETADSLELCNNSIIKSIPTSSRSARGMACPMLIFDELAYSMDSNGNASGDALYNALAPSSAQFGESGKVLLLSSPYKSEGIFYDIYKQGISGLYPDIQVVNLPSWEVNPTLSKSFLESEKARDPDMFNVEYGANFSQNLASFLNADLVHTAINYHRNSLLPQDCYLGDYFLSLDPAKGSRDAYTACIAHFEDSFLVVDLFHQFTASWGEDKKKQVNIAEVESWIIEMHNIYGFTKVCLDQYNSISTIQRLSGLIDIQEINWSASSKTKAYTKLRELFNSQKIELYPHVESLKQLKNLSVFYKPGGSWSVSGGTGAAVDDFVSALAGILLISDYDADFDAIEAMTRKEPGESEYAIQNWLNYYHW
ncbi:hypothetical protein [Tolypothrix sp. VBCCA 56010]|uniref:hypothetical protein n=1 Tax=Tolypothrix sp. VBCCA 56010 TaxID=3137731 RepID=UPI003D7E5DA2